MTTITPSSPLPSVPKSKTRRSTSVSKSRSPKKAPPSPISKIHPSQTPKVPPSPSSSRAPLPPLTPTTSHSSAVVPPGDPEIFTGEINSLCLDYLLNECVPLSLRVQEKLMKNETDLGSLMKSLKIKETDDDQPVNDQSALFQPGRVDYMNDEKKYLDINSMYRVENYGFEIGFKVTDCLVYERNVKEGVNMKLSDSLEIMKFICRDVWKVFYGKQMDNLRTNHIGTFVLIENSFKPLVHFSTGKGEADTVRKAAPYLQFPCGLIRGILASLGVDSVVKAELNGKFPSVSFNVQTS